MGTANLRKEVIGSIRDMRAEREQALADYIDTLIRAHTHHTGNQPEHDDDQPQDTNQHDGHDEHTENQPW